ncbi:potassium/proton antiporter [Pseudalkalibacillus salsuginis]|uniref:potassium/proton antiporter n=1 Tax=Pseudalkalibacillus salsuginis TaxID=2910972 RepID=UPI001F16F8F6|nr:potassium/proton antiporter [Pseudalkalibacillus salsuginis]MCF6410812.1 potassium/proton antiporter [Pseudalkalibacillus salsuginis]
MEFSVENTILVVSILLIIGVITAKFSSRLGLPSLVFFIVVGMVLSQYIYYDNAILTQLIGTFALIVILFEGGLQTEWHHIKKVYKPSLSLATIGVLVTTSVTGIAAKYILGVTWFEGFLFGAIVGSTDAAAVFAALGNKDIKRKLTSTLEAESGTNDPMAIFLTVAFLELIQDPETNPFLLMFNFFWQMGIGLLFGFILGKMAVWLINNINLDSSGLYPVLSIAIAVFAFGITTLFEASGFLAVYTMAVFLGNHDITYRHSIVRFNEGFAWMMQILMFILLGMLVFPDQLLKVFWQGILLSSILMIVARPVGVFISLVFTKFNLKEKLFISWAGLKGAVPIVLATYPLVVDIENSGLIFNVVFFVVFTSALIQGATISPLSKYFKFSKGAKAEIAHSLELVSIGKTKNEMMEIEIEEGALILNHEIKDLPLPENTLITAVIRGESLITPTGNTTLQPRDTLFILVHKAKRGEVKNIIRKKEESE